MKKTVIIFLVMSIPFGVIMGILSLNIWAGVIGGLFFGFFMALILGIINYFATKDIGGDQDSSVHQKHEIELELPYPEAFQLCKESIPYINAKITHENVDKGVLLGKTKISIWTWGDKVSFYVQKIDEETTKVYIESKPAVSTTVVDYGKNLKNIKVISNYLLQQN